MPKREGFLVYAEPELRRWQPWQPGVCDNPACGAHFAPARAWQIYCSSACQRAEVAAARRWGHRLALPSLVHRLTKYSQDEDARAVSLAARRYIGQVQSDWLAERKAQEAAR